MFSDFLVISDPIINYFLAIILLIAMVFNCLAIWESVKNNDRPWFIVLVIINTFGILPIIYLFRKKYFNEKNKFYRISILGLSVFFLLLVALILYTLSNPL